MTSDVVVVVVGVGSWGSVVVAMGMELLKWDGVMVVVVDVVA